MSNKTTNQTPVNNAPKTTAPKFDLKNFGQTLQNQFKDCDTVDLVFDTDMTDGKDGGCRATNEIEYRYMHIFRKGTTKNCFQLYTSSKGCEFVVGKSINELVPESPLFSRREVVKAGKVSHLVYSAAHENAAATLTLLIEAYKMFNAGKVKQAEEKKAQAEAEKAKKAEEKKATKAEEKKTTAKAKKSKTNKAE